MALIEQARSALLFAELIEVVLAGTVAIRLGGVGRLRQRVADRRGRALVLPSHHRLQPVVISDAEVFDDVDLAIATVGRQNRTSQIGGRGDAHLPRRGAREKATAR